MYSAYEFCVNELQLQEKMLCYGRMFGTTEACKHEV